MDQPELDSFVEGLINDKNIEGLTPEGRKQIAGEIKDELVQQINRAVLMELPDDKLDEIDQKLEAGEIQPEELQAIIQDSASMWRRLRPRRCFIFRPFI